MAEAVAGDAPKADPSAGAKGEEAEAVEPAAMIEVWPPPQRHSAQPARRTPCGADRAGGGQKPRERLPDPASPFAKLLALKAELEKKGKS